MAMAERREIRLWGANLETEGSTHTGRRQGRRLGKRAENTGYARPDLRPLPSLIVFLLDTGIECVITLPCRSRCHASPRDAL